ncbi:MAG: oxidoreductase [Rhizobiales bacterium]|nr:oxidoreductase [Hyphomicrobiales bacterium]
MHVVVIGSGMIGSSIAYECAKAGAKVTVFDAGNIGGKASATSFSWTNATSKNPRSYFALNVAGMRAHIELRRDFGGSPWLWQTGSLEWRTTQEGQEWQRGNFQQMSDWGYGVEWLDPRKLAEMEPDLDIGEIGAYPIAYYPEEGWVDPMIYSAWLLREAGRRHDATIRSHTPITRVETKGSRVEAVHTAGGERIKADYVINCTGSQADADLGVEKVPLAPTVGILAFPPPVATTLRSQLHADDLNVRPDGAGRLMIQKASIEKRFDEAKSLEADGPEAQELLDVTRKIMPVLEGVRIEAVRTTYRPMPKDGFPCVGAMPDLANYYVAVTHSGVTLAPYLGKALADEIVVDRRHKALDPFAPDRFFAEPSSHGASAELLGQQPVEG